MRKLFGVPLVAAAAIALLVLVLGSGSSSGASSPVAVFPSAGTPVASPKTQISFRGVAPDDLKAIQVEGSQSGKHDGKVEAHSDGKGASFIPNTPFTPGETVTVKANQQLVGEQNGAVTFSIAVPSPEGDVTPPAPDPAGTPPEAQHFKSEPKLRPASVKVLKRSKGMAKGDIFVAAKAGQGQDGPMIVNDRGQLVWFHRVPHHTSAFDFRTQTYQGKPVLTWWQGPVLQGEGYGEGLILDSSYKLIGRVKAGNGFKADLHEFLITPQNTAFIIAYSPVKWDLSSIGGPADGRALDSFVQEIDIKTGLVMFEWHSLGHIGLDEAFTPLRPGQPFDGSHVNSVDVERNGNLLVSARNTSTLYEVDRQSGNILWRLGGKKSDFKLGAGADTIGQHDARRAADGTITAFDNGSLAPPGGRESRGVRLAVDENGKTANLAKEYKHADPLKTFSQGGVQNLPNGNVFVGWGGSNSFFSEFDKDGNMLFDAQFQPSGDDTYRAYRLPWSGAKPFRPPAVSATVKGHRTTVYASWNGATDVASWRVLMGKTKSDLKAVRRARPRGFETGIGVRGAQTLVEVQALDKDGNVLATSRAVHPHRG